MQYNLVSGDSHVDMSWLPGDLFVDNAPQALKPRMPLVSDTDEGERWVVGDQVLGRGRRRGLQLSAHPKEPLPPHGPHD